jgi:hypothetical protein
MSMVVFNDKATFHVSGKVNAHNCCIWAWQNPRTSVDLQWDSPNVRCVLCIIKA